MTTYSPCYWSALDLQVLYIGLLIVRAEPG